MKTIQLKTGDKFGRLTVIKLDHIEHKRIKTNNKPYNTEYYLCKCDCGNESSIAKTSLKSGRTKSCGCLQKEKSKQSKNYTHNLSKTRLYTIWRNIKQRCFDNNCHNYKYYGGRGIVMCEEWKNDFMSFYNWAIQNSYQDNLTIDRIDNNRNYEPNNCRWVDSKIQANNRRSNHFIEYNNKKYTISQLSDKLNMNYKLLYSRILYNNKNYNIFENKKHINQYL